jgi:hypothetical protein
MMGYFPLNESSMNVKWTWTIFAAFAVPRKLNVAENKDILGCRSALYNTKPGWWFRKWIVFFHILGIIISTDFHIFQRGSNHQPETNDCWLRVAMTANDSLLTSCMISDICIRVLVRWHSIHYYMRFMFCTLFIASGNQTWRYKIPIDSPFRSMICPSYASHVWWHRGGSTS